VSPGFRAWRFDVPFADVAQADLGLRTTARGGIAMVEGHASVRQALRLLLSTVPGERVMRPEYGCELQRLVFSPNDDTTAGLAMHYVRQAVERFEPRVEVTHLDAERRDDRPGHLYILLAYRIRATAVDDQLTIGVDLTGASG